MGRRWHQLGILCGLLTFPILILSTTIFTLLRPDYDHLSQSFSELGELHSPNYFWFNTVTFGLISLLGFLFVYSLKQYWRDKMGPWLYRSHILGQISWLMTGLFPTSFDIEWLYNVHLAWAICVYLFGATTIALSVKLFSSEDGMGLFSLVSIWLLFGVWASILLSYSVLSPYWAQLISIFSYFTWQAIYSLVIYSRIR